MEKYSTGIRNHVLSGGSLRQIVKGGKLLIYSGSQPTDADQAVAGTLLCSITQASGAWDDELRSAGSVQLTTWTGDSITSITVSGVEVLGSTITFATYGSKILGAAAIATTINKYNPLGIIAASNGVDLVTLYAPWGVSPVTWAVVTTESGAGAVAADVNFNTAVAGDAGLNGLEYALAASGAIAQSGVWSGVVTSPGTAGWFRIVGAGIETSALSLTLPRIDGVITSTGGGGDITLTSTALALSAPITLTGVELQYEATGK